MRSIFAAQYTSDFMRTCKTPIFWALLIGMTMSGSPTAGQFFLNGRAVALNDTCYQLTPEINFVAGSTWHGQRINLNESFDVVVRLFLGCKDADGADGIVFGFQPVSTSIGAAGGGMGFANITPSIGIEIDTHQNIDLSDPPYDHLAIVRNGSINHSSGNTLAGPVQASAFSANIEDCRFHEMRVSWNAAQKHLQVYFDCVLRLNYTGDIVGQIFGGNPMVFWGFTAATGALNNIHQVCFNYTSFLDQLQDVSICPGARYPLQVRGGVSYRWTPEEGLSNPFIANPIASPAHTTTYRVEMLDACNRSFYDEITITVTGDSLSIDLGQDTIICEGTVRTLDAGRIGDQYRWNTGDTTQSIQATAPGEYAVTVSWSNPFCISPATITLISKPQPFVNLGNDTLLCYGQRLLLRASLPEAEYLWQDGSQADTFLVAEPGIYKVAVRNVCNTVSDLISVDFENCRRVYFPSAFSPNDDGVNDTFEPMHSGTVLRVHGFRIYDRWGGIVYEWLEDAPGKPLWNGFRHDHPMPPGLYVYEAELTFRDGSRSRFCGEVTLIK